MKESATAQCTATAPSYATFLYDKESLPDHLRRFHVDESTGCLIWDGPPNAAGHGQVRIPGGTTQTAHVAVWEFFFGPLDAGIHLHHRCPNKLCVNPLHNQPRLRSQHRAEHTRLRWKAQKADPSLRLVGQPAGKKHLTVEQRQEIRDLYFSRRANQQELADLYDVSRPTISKIVKSQPQPHEGNAATPAIGGGPGLNSVVTGPSDRPAALVAGAVGEASA